MGFTLKLIVFFVIPYGCLNIYATYMNYMQYITFRIKYITGRAKLGQIVRVSSKFAHEFACV